MNWQHHTGSLSPSTYPTEAITIRCDCCARMGRYKRQTLIERYGADAAMPDVLNEVTACERNDRFSTDRCKAYFEELRAAASALPPKAVVKRPGH